MDLLLQSRGLQPLPGPVGAGRGLLRFLFSRETQPLPEVVEGLGDLVATPSELRKYPPVAELFHVALQSRRCVDALLQTVPAHYEGWDRKGVLRQCEGEMWFRTNPTPFQTPETHPGVCRRTSAHLPARVSREGSQLCVPFQD